MLLGGRLCGDGEAAGGVGDDGGGMRLQDPGQTFFPKAYFPGLVLTQPGSGVPAGRADMTGRVNFIFIFQFAQKSIARVEAWIALE